MKVCVVGSGGREHALAVALSKTASVVVTPGNPGIPALTGEVACSAQLPAETDADRLLFRIKQALHPLLGMLASRGHALAALGVRLRPDAGPWRADLIRPAAPTLDPVQILDLVRLRLDTARPGSGVIEVALEACGVPASPDQFRILPEHPTRDLAAGTRALARLRARYGDDAVVRAVLHDGHLPEARFRWEPVDQVRLPRPRHVETRPLVRRILARPVPVTVAVRGRDDPSVTGSSAAGPYIVSGGWWLRETRRAYYFAETSRGDLLWVFHDHVRGRWYLHGLVE